MPQSFKLAMMAARSPMGVNRLGGGGADTNSMNVVPQQRATMLNALLGAAGMNLNANGKNPRAEAATESVAVSNKRQKLDNGGTTTDNNDSNNNNLNYKYQVALRRIIDLEQQVDTNALPPTDGPLAEDLMAARLQKLKTMEPKKQAPAPAPTTTTIVLKPAPPKKKQEGPIKASYLTENLVAARFRQMKQAEAAQQPVDTVEDLKKLVELENLKKLVAAENAKKAEAAKKEAAKKQQAAKKAEAVKKAEADAAKKAAAAAAVAAEQERAKAQAGRGICTSTNTDTSKMVRKSKAKQEEQAVVHFARLIY